MASKFAIQFQIFNESISKAVEMLSWKLFDFLLKMLVNPKCHSSFVAAKYQGHIVYDKVFAYSAIYGRKQFVMEPFIDPYEVS